MMNNKAYAEWICELFEMWKNNTFFTSPISTLFTYYSTSQSLVGFQLK